MKLPFVCSWASCISLFALCSTLSACSSDSPNSGEATGGAGGSQAGTGGSASETGGAPAATGGAACAPMALFSFDANRGGFALNDYVETTVDEKDDSGKGLVYLNLNAPGDAGVVAVPPEIEHSDAQEAVIGHTPIGALSIVAQFTNWNQWLIAQATAPRYPSGEVVDFTGMTITAQIYVDGNGLTPSKSTGGAKLFIQTGGGFIWGEGGWTNLASNEWITLTLDTNAPASKESGWDAGEPKMMGVYIASGGGGTSGDYGEAHNVTIYIDDIQAVCP